MVNSVKSNGESASYTRMGPVLSFLRSQMFVTMAEILVMKLCLDVRETAQ